MKRVLLFWLLAAGLMAAPPAAKPKLIIAIVVDQFRYDYLTRFRSDYKAGFNRLLTKGAVFTNARYIHFPTVTAVGHSTILTGATPATSGIVGNEWFDQDEQQRVTSVSDANTRTLGGNGGRGASPRRLSVRLKMAYPGKVRSIGVSLKDRSAILTLGNSADGAYWYDVASGSFVSSTYYFADAPGWVKNFNLTRLPEKYIGAKWLNYTLPTDLKALYGTDSRSPLLDSPFGNELVVQFAERAAWKARAHRYPVRQFFFQ
jgi:hypothetical protein